MARKDYPLIQVLEIKLRRVDAAEQVVREKKEILAQEETRLKERIAERDKVKNHHHDKLTQLREELDQVQGTNSPTIQQMKVYIKVVQEKLVSENKKVDEQKKKVEAAEKDLEDAKLLLKQRRLEVDKVQTHREMWEKIQNREDEIKQENVMDELGTLTFSARKIRNEK